MWTELGACLVLHCSFEVYCYLHFAIYLFCNFICRLTLMLLLSTCSFVLYYIIPYGLQTVAVMAFFGILLSCEHGIILWIVELCQRSPDQCSIQHRHWGYILALFAWPMIVCATAATTNHFYTNGTISTDAANYISYGIIGLFAVELLLAKAQTVYVLGGLWRNPLYPPGVTSHRLVRSRRKLLAAFGDMRRVIMSVGRRE